MRRKTVSGIMLSLFLTGMLILAFNIQPVKADWTWTETVYIRADGRVEPDTAPVLSVDNITYTLTDNIVGNVPEGATAIVVERDDIVVDGAGYTVQGTGEGKGIDISYRSNATIKNVEIRAFRYGTYLYESSNNTITENNITTSWSGIWLQDSSNNTISGNNIRNTWNAGTVLWPNSNSNKISGNNITDNNWDGVILFSSNFNKISGNNITNNSFGISLSGSNNTISGNSITNNEDYGISVSGSNNTISGNSMANDGISVSGFNNIISGNTMTNSGIGLDSSDSNCIYGNNIKAGKGSGIFLVGSRGNSIYGNKVENNVGDGISLTYGSGGNHIYSNTITNNDCGISFVDVGGNHVFGNNLANNVYGIYLYGRWLDGNHFYHNNLMNNTHQVLVKTPGKFSVLWWDEGYPSGGNFWSDYTGVDLYSGSDQNETGSDGIGDTSYLIPILNPYGDTIGFYYDNYPLMNPWAWHNLTIHSSPTGIVFTVDDGSRTTPWSGTYIENTSVSLMMPEIHTVGDTRYYWKQWSDGNTSRSRTIAINTNITLTGVFFHMADLNQDGAVDMRDISLAAAAFGSYPDHPRWNPIADINQDNKVDMRDLATIARNFGKTV